MCNNGLDTRLLARRCATVVGVDFSSQAIEWAKNTSMQYSNAVFIHSDIVSHAFQNPMSFDFAVASWGITCWVEDMRLFATAIYYTLKQGGFFYLCDVHPLINCLGSTGGWVDSYPMPTKRRQRSGDVVIDYHAPGNIPQFRMHWWWWGLGEVVSEFTNVGFRVLFLKEHDFLWPEYFGTERRVIKRGSKGYLANMPEGMPLSYSLKVTKPPPNA
jgi:SAM-dependent methyltransferase